jgi:hypothetical protein
MRPVIRLAVVVLALVAAAAFSLSVVAGVWWSIGPVEIGPKGTSHCFGGAEHCGLQWVGAAQKWPTLGIGTWGAGLVASFGLILVAALVAGKRQPRMIAKSTLVAIVMAIVMGVMFFVGFPDLQGSGIDRGVLLYGIGIAFGVAATVVVAWGRVVAPVASPPPAASPR